MSYVSNKTYRLSVSRGALLAATPTRNTSNNYIIRPPSLINVHALLKVLDRVRIRLIRRDRLKPRRQNTLIGSKLDTALHPYYLLRPLLTLLVSYSPLLRQESGHDINICHVLYPNTSPGREYILLLAFRLACSTPGSLPQTCRIPLEQSVIIEPCLSQVLQIDHIARTAFDTASSLQSC